MESMNCSQRALIWRGKKSEHYAKGAEVVNLLLYNWFLTFIIL